MSLTLITPPAIEPVTLAALKLQLGLDPSEDTDPVKSHLQDAQLRRLISTARTECENITGTAFITQTWRLTLRHWPYRKREYVRHHEREIVLPKAPFQSMASFTYLDTNGDQQAMVEGSYQIDPAGATQPAVIAPLFATPWPPLLPGQLAAVVLEFICGYGDTPQNVPATIQQAILLLAQFYYENGAVTDLPVPRVIANLLSRETDWSS